MVKKKPNLTQNDYFFYSDEMIKMDYKIIPINKPKGHFNGAPRKITGREVTFVFTANDHESVQHCTYDMINKEWRDLGTDMVQSLVRKKDTGKALYFSKAIKRTQNVIVEALSRAWINKWRVMNFPRCPHCSDHRLLEIRERYKKNPDTLKWEPTGQYYYGCFNTKEHPDEKPYFVGWDKLGPQGKLPPKAKEFVDKMRKKVADYRKHNQKLGIVRTPARKIRKKWEKRNPDNPLLPVI